MQYLLKASKAKSSSIVLYCLMALLAGTVLPAAAADEDRSWQLGIALGAGQRSNPLVNTDAIDINAVIDFSWYGDRFFFDNGDLGYLLHENNRLAINWVATYNNERNYYNYLTGDDLGLNILQSLGDDFRFTSIAEDAATDSSLILISEEGKLIGRPPGFVASSDTDLVSALSDSELPGRSSAINSGLEMLYLSPWGDIQAQVLTDVSGTHSGQEAWLSWTKPWYFATNTGIDEVALTLGMEWKSADLVGYYYGVRPEESFPGRRMYSGSSGTNTFIRLSARHVFSDHWQAVSMLEREYLSKAITDSPVVLEDSVDTFFLGLYYRF
jgi:outer membrane protein